MGLKNEIYNNVIIRQFKIAGNIKNQIDSPEERIILSSLFLFSFIKVFIEHKRNTVGKIIGNKDGKCKKVILKIKFIGISFEELLLKSSIKSTVKNKKQQNKKIIKKAKRFSLSK